MEILKAMPRAKARTAVDAETLESLAWPMDAQFQVPGLAWHFGLNTLLDLIPGIGDVTTTIIAATVPLSAVRLGVPRGGAVAHGGQPVRLCRRRSAAVCGRRLRYVVEAESAQHKLLRRYLGSTQEVRQARSADWLFAGAVIALVLLLVVASWESSHGCFTSCTFSDNRVTNRARQFEVYPAV